jgi:hypothetical protein
MAIVEFNIPQIISKRRILKVTPEEADKIEQMFEDEKANWIWDKMTPLEKQHTLGEKWTADFADIDGYGIMQIDLHKKHSH